MTIPSERPIASANEWRGVYIRERHGPTTKGYTTHVGPWHRIQSIGPRVQVMCGKRAIMWPSGGLRWEIARPDGLSLPGDMCPRCQYPQQCEEVEVASPDEVLDELATRVAERLLERLPKP